MKNKILKPKLARELRNAKQQLASDNLDESQFQSVTDALGTAGQLAAEAADETIARGLELLTRVSELATSMQCDGDLGESVVDEFVFFLNENIELVGDAVEGKDRSSEIEAFIDTANTEWSDYLSLFDADAEAVAAPETPDASWDDPFASLDSAEPESEADAEDDLDSNQIQMMLAALSNGATAEDAKETSTEENAPAASTEETKQHSPAASENVAPAATKPQTQSKTTKTQAASTDSDPDAEARAELASDSELLQAYLDDALRCLASMEQAALQIEESPHDHDTARQFCRELHTLKGASGTVGLHGLASELHDLESSLEALFGDSNDTIDADPLFAAVDQVRDVIDRLQNPEGDSAPEPQVSEPASPQVTAKPDAPQSQPRPTAKRKAEFANYASGDDASVRIRASQLDRLMDMLAELVVLRNRRESNVAEFNEFNEELARCAARVSFVEEQSERAASEFQDDDYRNELNYLSEVAKDISAVSTGLRELQKPVVQDNQSISRFIRDFRQELMQLRRIPVSGLFNRLQRAARDAAKSEQKKIRVQTEGDHAGLEQEIQEKLFDPLLHIVRNSVSHGVESPEVRQRCGKSETGTITLSASSNAQLLIIEVRDDGGGINYDAVRRRGIEKGLISADQRQTDDQLARLIFHPGFSTREQASEISGRGVGMDVVATTIEQMRGRIEVDSVPGEGTTIRLLVPLRTGIEHVMVFRSGDQLFALPMQSITAAKSGMPQSSDVKLVSLGQALSLPIQSEPNGGEILMLRASSQNAASKRKMALAVEELIGPEEVVVRGLPSLLRNHPLINGITLAGSGKKVLLLDTDRLVEFGLNADLALGDAKELSSSKSGQSQQRVLVVDDSLTARKVLGKHLRKLGWHVVEAGDGMDAIEKLRQDSFDLVLTDLDMPRMGGLELLGDIENGNYCDAPRVVVSSRNENKFRDQAMDSGASEFLNKPVNETKVKELLDQLGLQSQA